MHTVIEAENGMEAVKAIMEQQPDLVFLDIQMPGMNGFEVIEAVGIEDLPPVIFVTAYDQYAIKAFEIQAATTRQEQETGVVASQPIEGAGDQEGQGVLWTPEGRFVRPVFVRVGPTDDIRTQVQGEGLTENLPVVTGQIEIDAASRSAGGSNPFLPKPPKGGRRGPPPPM